MEKLTDFLLCRLCLSRSPYAVDIFHDKGRHGYIAAHAIEELLNFKVSKYDQYPKTVCPECLDKLTDFKIFKEQCEESKLAFDKSTSYGNDEGINKPADDIVVEERIKTENVDDESEDDSEIVEIPVEKEPESGDQHEIIIKDEPIDCGYEDEERNEARPSSAEGDLDTKVQDIIDEHKMELRSPEERQISKRSPRSRNDQDALYRTLKAALFQCQFCNTSFDNARELKQHEKNEHKNYKCALCEKGFTTLRQITEHLSSHTGERRCACPVCGRTFSNRSNMVTHLTVHSDEFRFNCEFCGKGFRQKGNLLTHRRQHTGERPFVCKTCGKGFPHSSSLKSHEMTHLKAFMKRKYVIRKGR